MDEVEVDIFHIEGLERRANALFHALVPWVVELGGDPDLLTWHTRVLDTLSDLVLVAVSKSSVDVPVAGLQCGGDGFADLIGL